MMGRETAERYRKMSNAERLRITLQMIRESTPYLFHGTREQVKRRFELLRLQNDNRNLRILEGLARDRQEP